MLYDSVVNFLKFKVSHAMDKIIDEKLNLLKEIQDVDSEIDTIERLRGELPEEIEELNDLLITYNTQLAKLENELQEIEKEASKYRILSEEAKGLTKRYKDQQKEVKNKKEIEALNKEIDFQILENKLAESKLKEARVEIKEKQQVIEETKKLIKQQGEDIKKKTGELKKIISENEKQERALIIKVDKLKKQLPPSLINSYNKLRNNLKNRLAVVIVRKGACGGCFNMVTPQKQLDIAARNRIIICEHCCRIIYDIEYPETEQEEIKKEK